MVLIAITMVGLLAFLGLVFDVSNAYAQRRWMQNSADAAALAGGGQLASNSARDAAAEQLVWNAITTYANKNGSPNVVSAYFINSSGQNIGAPLPANGGIPGSSNCKNTSCASGVRVTVTKTFSTFFLGVVSTRNGTVGATSAAQTGAPSGARSGIVPIAVPQCYVRPNSGTYQADTNLCGGNPSGKSHPIVGQGAQTPSGATSWRGVVDFNNITNDAGTQIDWCPGGGSKGIATTYIAAGGYNGECGPVNVGNWVAELPGTTGGAAGAQDYAAYPQYYAVGKTIYVLVYPEGTARNGANTRVKVIGFAKMQITYIDTNHLDAIWVPGQFYLSGPIDWNATTTCCGAISTQLWQ